MGGSKPGAVDSPDLTPGAPKSREFGIALEPQILKISVYAVFIGIIGGLVAQGLLELIYLFTNFFFFGKLSFAISYPVGHAFGALVILIPPFGGLVVGLMIYYLEPTLKGHGIPEAMEAVLFGQSRMRFRVGILKPLATAFAIGTGGPFGAEGPIIQTGAAFGSIFGQAINLTPYNRRILLAAGAAAGMAATFKAPLAGLMVAVELLLFEMRARSFIPVAFAAATATAVRVYFAGWAPLFPMPPFELRHMQELWLFALLGVVMGAAGLAMIRVLFWLEDFFDHLPIKRALLWSPAIGALLLGVIGYFYPEVFGTGYDTIRAMLNDKLTVGKLMGVSVAKFWALTISLGSGTTGGVFAPSLIVGGGLGASYALAWRHFFPQFVSDPAFYSLIAMGAAFGGIARAPFTSIVFLFELSRNPNSLLPLIVCVMVADGFVRLFSRESIMTGKLVRRGLIVLQDYSVPVLMRARIGEVMRKQFSTIRADAELRSVILEMAPKAVDLLPVVTEDGSLAGILEARDLLQVESSDHHFRAKEVARQDYVLAYPEEPVDKVSREMLTKNVENVVVVEHGARLKPIGIARAADILRLRRWLMQEEGSSEASLDSQGGA